MALRLVVFYDFRTITMRSSVNRAVKLAKTSTSFLKARAISTTVKKQWNDRLTNTTSAMGNGSSLGIHRFLQEVGSTKYSLSAEIIHY